MKKFFCSLALTAGLLSIHAEAKARSHEPNVVELIAMAMVAQDIDALEQGNLFDQIKQIIEETKAYLLENFDYNENGRLDRGSEIDDALGELEDVFISLLDRNDDGRLSKKEIAEALKELKVLLREEVEARACIEIIQKAQDKGDRLKFFPVLRYLYNRCI